jgi:putative DNA-invertase from lambdoid prophage Rac
MKIALYCRVSTDRQSHDLQLAELREYCQRRGWIDVQEFTDVVSGAAKSRLELDRLMALIRRGKLDAVLSYRLDRLGRSLPHLAQLLSEFQSHRVALIVPGQGIDTSSSNPAAALQLNILASIAQFERELIRERVIAGISAAKARGVRFGRPSTAARHLEAVRALIAQGRTTREIAVALGISKTMAARLAKIVNFPKGGRGD